jgi:hypothetical protein
MKKQLTLVQFYFQKNNNPVTLKKNNIGRTR